MFNIGLAVLPTIVIIGYILWFDRYNKEPIGLLIMLFLFGCLSVIPALILENFVPDISSVYTYFGLFIYCLLGIALIEEGVKFFTTKVIAYRNKAFDEIYDGIIYCVMVSLGFATIENIMYVQAYGASVALLRAITAVPAHTIFAVTMGYYLGLSKAFPSKRSLYQLLSLAMPILLHGIYDFIIYVSYDWLMLIFIVYALYLYRKAFMLVKRTYNIEPFR